MLFSGHSHFFVNFICIFWQHWQFSITEGRKNLVVPSFLLLLFRIALGFRKFWLTVIIHILKLKVSYCFAYCVFRNKQFDLDVSQRDRGQRKQLCLQMCKRKRISLLQQLKQFLQSWTKLLRHFLLKVKS